MNIYGIEEIERCSPEFVSVIKEIVNRLDRVFLFSSIEAHIDTFGVELRFYFLGYSVFSRIYFNEIEMYEEMCEEDNKNTNIGSRCTRERYVINKFEEIKRTIINCFLVDSGIIRRK